MSSITGTPEPPSFYTEDIDTNPDSQWSTQQTLAFLITVDALAWIGIGLLVMCLIRQL